MKIETVRTFVVDAYRANYVFVKIIADNGSYGVGEGTVEHREQAVAHAISEFEPQLLGRDPFCHRRHCRTAQPRQLLAHRRGHSQRHRCH
ncbi:hypothetical protein N8D56_07575 [Devosia sp. A8/3-2]|nr:hypothetical protein N8D56_07575 [Devosia sp. A8/3-2]